MRTYEQIEVAVKSLNFKWFIGVFSLNYIWERVDFHATNHFTDFLHVCYKDDKGINNILTIPVTTKAGLNGALLEPAIVRGIIGTAVIKSPQQIIGGWEFRDTFGEFSKYPYFRQCAPVDYWRDGNKDTEIDKINEEDDKINETHWHIMSHIGTIGSGNVNNFSEGCMGAVEPLFKLILPITRISVKLYGTKVTGTIIESQHIK